MTTLEKPRDVFLAGCRSIAADLAPLGFRPRADGQELRRQRDSFVEKVWFQSSHRNVAGHSIAIWPGASVHSKHLKAWRDKAGPLANWGDFVAASRIESIAGTPFGAWDLADPAERPTVLASIGDAIRGSVLAWFDFIEDRDRLLEVAQERDIHGIDISHLTEYAVFLDRRDRATAILKAWLARHPGFAGATSDRGLTQLVARHGLPVKLPDFASNLANVEETADRLRTAAPGPMVFK